MSRQFTRDFGLESSLNKITGYKTVNKFGETINADNGVATDVWDGADGSTATAIWVPPTQARIHTIVSTSNLDSDTGGANPQSTGARTIRVDYLADWDTAEASETVVLDGTTGVAMGNAAVMINRMEVLTWGSGGLNVGVITATAATDATITAAVLAGSNQTQMCIYGLPSTQKLRVKKFYASIVKGTGITQRADGEVLFMRDPATNASGNNAWTNKENFLLVEGQAPWKHEYNSVPKKFDGACIIKIQVTANANDIKCIAAFDAFLMNN